jgi:hypothetical protein
MKCEHRLTNHGSEFFPHDSSRKVQKSVWYNLSYKRFTICEHQRKQGRHDSCLSRAHDHLMTHRSIVPERIEKLVDKDYLALSQHQRIRKLKDKVSRVKFNKIGIRWIHFHEVAFICYIRRDFGRLEIDLLTYSHSLPRIIRRFDFTKQKHQFG